MSSVGYFTSIVQKLSVYKLNDNADLRAQELMIEIFISITSALFVVLKYQEPHNPLITDMCSEKIDITDLEKDQIDFVYALLSQTSDINFQYIISVLVVLYATMMIMMLQRTQKLGELIMMVGQMLNELKKFLFTFGLILMLFILVGKQLNEKLKKKTTSLFGVFQDIFDGLNGQ